MEIILFFFNGSTLQKMEIHFLGKFSEEVSVLKWKVMFLF